MLDTRNLYFIHRQRASWRVKERDTKVGDFGLHLLLFFWRIEMNFSSRSVPYDLAFTVPRAQPNGTPRGDFGPVCYTMLSTTIKTLIEGISFGRMVFIPLIQVQILVESVPECTESVCGGSTPYIFKIFLLPCHSFVCEPFAHLGPKEDTCYCL